ncbi:MAG: hypothetical protein WC749_01930 [Dehalococcoidia bacterium]
MRPRHDPLSTGTLPSLYSMDLQEFEAADEKAEYENRKLYGVPDASRGGVPNVRTAKTL